MKNLLRVYCFHLLALWMAKNIFGSSLVISGDIAVWLIAAGILTCLNILLKPVLKLLFFPVNAITLGLFSLVINTGIFYIFLKLSPKISINPWTFPGGEIFSWNLPKYDFNIWLTLFIISLTVSLITNGLTYLVK